MGGKYWFWFLSGLTLACSSSGGLDVRTTMAEQEGGTGEGGSPVSNRGTLGDPCEPGAIVCDDDTGSNCHQSWAVCGSLREAMVKALSMDAGTGTWTLCMPDVLGDHRCAFQCGSPPDPRYDAVCEALGGACSTGASLRTVCALP